MKLKAKAVDGFVARPDPRVATVLLYGPDAGLVGERAPAPGGDASSTTCGDPFRVSELAGDELRSAPAGWSRRRRRCACWAGAGWCGCAMPATWRPSPCATCWRCRRRRGSSLLEAGDLPRQLQPAQADRGRRRRPPRCPATATRSGISAAFVRSLLAEHGLEAEPDALAYLQTHLGGDRAVTRAEIAKLALYLADQPGRRA